MIRLLICLLALVALAGCTDYVCKDGKVYYRHKSGGGDGLWHEEPGSTCTIMPGDKP